MPRVEKTDGGLVYIRPLDRRFEIGDRADVSAEQAQYLVEERGDFDVVDAGDADVATEDESTSGESEEGVGPPFDPAEHTVDELESKLEDGDYGGSELHALAAAEEDGKNRETALDAIKVHTPENEEA